MKGEAMPPQFRFIDRDNLLKITMNQKKELDTEDNTSNCQDDEHNYCHLFIINVTYLPFWSQ